MTEAKQAPRGWSQSSTCNHTEAISAAHGRTMALNETGAQALGQILAAQAKAKFGSNNTEAKALLDALAAAQAIDRLKLLGETLLEASDWTAWLAGVEAPTAAPNDFPEYAFVDEIDLEPDKPFIDMTAQAHTVAGQKMIIQFRLQKWYQPDLGQVLYEESCKLEKQFKVRPLFAIILMWPSADGPAVTGRYQATDAKGKKIDFRYEVKRAWEMPPESLLNSPGTMMLVPLSKGAKERMPELIRSMKDRLAKLAADSATLEPLWATIYWSMGTVCSLEEAHAALGDLLPMIHATVDYKRAYGSGFRQGYTQALNEGPILAARALIRQQATRKFGEDPASAAALEAKSSFEELRAMAIGIMSEDSWSHLLGRKC
jgi:hypothetical protein